MMIRVQRKTAESGILFQIAEYELRYFFKGIKNALPLDGDGFDNWLTFQLQLLG